MMVYITIKNSLFHHVLKQKKEKKRLSIQYILSMISMRKYIQDVHTNIRQKDHKNNESCLYSSLLLQELKLTYDKQL